MLGEIWEDMLSTEGGRKLQKQITEGTQVDEAWNAYLRALEGMYRKAYQRVLAAEGGTECITDKDNKSG